MIYNLKKFNHVKLGVISENKLENRSYFIPFSDKEKCLSCDSVRERLNSDLVTVLSGKWDFKYVADTDLLTDGFNTDKEIFTSINIPSSWQEEGFGIPIYLKESYPFRYYPPYIPKSSLGKFYSFQNNRKIKINNDSYGNTAGVYRKFIDISDLDKYYVISFLGADACIELHINGQYVGFSQGSMKTTEFLINDFLTLGKNEILIVVYKWAVCSYLECSDRFRVSGVLRDILLFAENKEHFFDIKISDFKNPNNTYNLNADLQILYNSSSSVLAEIYDGNKVIASKKLNAGSDTIMVFENLSVKEWSSEFPKLYDIIFTLSDSKGDIIECVKIQHGFKTVEINKNEFTVNGKRITLKGINYTEGEKRLNVSDIDEMERDVKLMKDYNINAVSVISPDPVFLALCDRYGIYVLDGAFISLGKKLMKITVNSASLSTKQKWADMFLEKVKSLYERDKNFTSVIIWSIGYNIASGKCSELCYKYMKYKSSLPVVCYGTQSSAFSDMKCDEFESVENIARQIKKNNSKPQLLVKYALQCGFGSGRLNDYAELFLKEPSIAGGFVWQFSDQSYKRKNSKYEYLYGGDMKEYMDDGYKCLSGIFLPDRTPKTAAENLKFAYRPLRAYYNDSILEIKNTETFSSETETAVSISVKSGSEQILSCSVPSVNPSKSFKKEITLPQNEECYIDVAYLKNGTALKEQIAVKEKTAGFKYEGGGKINVKHGEDFISAEFDGGHIKFVTKTGQLASYMVDGIEYVNQNPVNSRNRTGFYLNFFRSPFDSEMDYKKSWLANSFHNYKSCLRGISANKIDDNVVINIKTALTSPFKMLFFANFVYTINAGGIVTVDCTVTPKNILPYLPKMGMVLEMPVSFKNISYCGLGPFDNYPDFNCHCVNGLFNATCEDFKNKLIKPQECGNRGRVKYFKIYETEGNGLYFFANEKFLNINFKNYTPDALVDLSHKEDIVCQDTTAVYIDQYIKALPVFVKGGGNKLMKNSSKPKHLSFIMVPEKRLTKID